MQPGMSMAAVAMADGVNTNLLRRWVCEAQARPDYAGPKALLVPKLGVPTASAVFVPVQLPARASAADIRTELRRGATAINVSSG